VLLTPLARRNDVTDPPLEPDDLDDDDPLAALRAGPPPRSLSGVAAAVLAWPGSVRVAAVLGVVAVLGVGSLALRTGRESAPPELSLPTVTAAEASSSEPETTPTSTSANPLVHAAGAVVHPGLYELAPGSRVDDLVALAGGATPDADLDRVNLAAVVADGERVWIPRRGEPEPATVAGGADDEGPAGGGSAPGEEPDEGPIDLNTATVDELDTLPGIGPTTAAAIVQHRTANGPFRSVEELIDVRGIGEAKLAQLRDLVSV
jgi:competence protein ComEA